MYRHNCEYLIGYVRNETGIELSCEKQYLLISRLGPVLREHKLASIDALCRALKGGEGPFLRESVIDAMTTSETSFFRDPGSFEYLVQEVLPACLLARGPERKLRIWSAGSAGGQEAVSIAITLLEAMPALHDWDVQITASDVSPGMVAKCRELVFSEAEMARGMPGELRERYFKTSSEGAAAGYELRRWISPMEHNLVSEPPPATGFDIVFLRNVLVYFELTTRAVVMDHMCQSLSSHGYLILGAGEKAGGESYVPADFPRSNILRLAG